MCHEPVRRRGVAVGAVYARHVQAESAQEASMDQILQSHQAAVLRLNKLLENAASGPDVSGRGSLRGDGHL